MVTCYRGGVHQRVLYEAARHSCSEVVTCGKNFDFITVTFQTRRTASTFKSLEPLIGCP